MPRVNDLHRPASPRWLASAVLNSYAYFILPFLGGFGAAWVAHDVFWFSFESALFIWIGIGFLAFRMHPYPLQRIDQLTWWGVLVTIVFLALLAFAPLAAYAAVFWPVFTYTLFPAFLPAAIATVFVGYLVHEFTRQEFQYPTQEAPRPLPERGRAAGGLFRANDQATQADEAVRQARKNATDQENNP